MSIRPLHSPFLTRRGMLQAGAAGLLGLNVGDLWQLQAQGESNTGQAPRAKSVIYIFLA